MVTNEELLKKIEELEKKIERLDGLTSELDEDLGLLEEAVCQALGIDGDDEDDEECGCGCGHHHGYSDEDGDMFQLICSNCGDEIFIDESAVNQGSIECPNCKEVLEFSFEDEEDGDEDDDSETD
ncbi:MAG: hypothetical protein LBL93_03160 [Ruminococcus sp.]|jgi:phage FluMu protein Com|nr:hypothetical protein [Ruminococcus sp.]